MLAIFFLRLSKFQSYYYLTASASDLYPAERNFKSVKTKCNASNGTKGRYIDKG